MKLFGWGKSKDPQPQGRQQVSKPDPRSGSHGLDRSTSLSGMGSVMPGKGSSTSGRKQRGLFDEGYLNSTTTIPEADSEEKLQDKIRFVFSHEREGLLAIGTFALEQLQSIRNVVDGHQRGADPGDHEFGFGSGVHLLALDNDVMQSSDDEDQLQRSWLAARQTCDLPVFGDTSQEGIESEPEQGPAALNPTGVQQPWHDESKALTLYKANPNRNRVAVETPVFILAPELQSSLQRPFLPHWTDSVPPPVIAKVEGPFVDDDYYTTRLCGLLTKKKSQKSDRSSKRGLKYNQMAIVPAAGEDAKRIIPVEQAAQHETKRSLLKFAGGSMPSLGKLAKLWRASCTPSASARIAPERKPSPQVGSKVPPCGPKGEEVKKRVQTHERMMDNQGNHEHWIKDNDDCEFATFLFNMSQ